MATRTEGAGESGGYGPRRGFYARHPRQGLKKRWSNNSNSCGDSTFANEESKSNWHLDSYKLHGDAGSIAIYFKVDASKIIDGTRVYDICNYIAIQLA